MFDPFFNFFPKGEDWGTFPPHVQERAYVAVTSPAGICGCSEASPGLLWCDISLGENFVGDLLVFRA